MCVVITVYKQLNYRNNCSLAKQRKFHIFAHENILSANVFPRQGF